MGQVLTLVRKEAPQPAIIFGSALTKRLAELAADLTGVPLRHLMAERDHDTAHTRFAVMLAAREQGKSLSQIARVFGKDHTTVLDGVHRATQLEAADPDFAELVRLLRKEAAR